MRIAIIGNCQVQTYSTLASAMFGGSEIRTLDYSKLESRDEVYRQRFADGLTDFDIILVQTAHFSYTGERDLRHRYPGKVLTIANFYFRGIFPDSCNIGDFSDRLVEPSPVHSVVVLDAFMRRLSAEQAARQFTVENMERLRILDAWPASMEELRRREANGAIDVPGAALTEDACRRYPAFFTMNHPCLGFLNEYFHLVCKHAGLPGSYTNPSSLVDPLGLHDMTPVHDEIAEYLNLPYRTSQAWKINRLGGKYLSRESYVEACYAIYGMCELSALVVHSPMDLVARFRNDPQLEHLASGGAPGPATSDVRPYEKKQSQFDKVQTLSTIFGRQHEIAWLAHRVHSYLQVMDPKVESMVQMMRKLAEPKPPNLCERLTSVVLERPLAIICCLIVVLGCGATALVLLSVWMIGR